MGIDLYGPPGTRGPTLRQLSEWILGFVRHLAGETVDHSDSVVTSPARGTLTAGTVGTQLAELDGDVVAERARALAAEALLIPLTQKAAANGVATLGADGKLPGAQLPPLTIGETFTVASQAAMLALVAERGDIAIRTDMDPDGVFWLATDTPAVLASWIRIGAVDLTVDGPAVTPSLRTLGPGAQQAAAGADLAAETTRALAAEATKLAIAGHTPATVPVAGAGGDLVDETMAQLKARLDPALAATYEQGEPHLIYDVRTNGAVGDGVALEDVAFAAVLAKCGTRGTFKLPPGTYKFATGLVIPRGVVWEQSPTADLIYTGTGTALQFEGGGIVHDGKGGARALVRVRRESVLWAANQGATDTTSKGVVVRNMSYSHFHFLEVQNFHTAVEVRGDTSGCVGNKIDLGYLVNNKIGLALTQISGGWVNANKFGSSGGIRIDSGYVTGGVGDVGTRWIVTGSANGNTFDSVNLEGGVVNVEKAIEDGGTENVWKNCRWEALGAGQAHFLSASRRCSVEGGYGNFGFGNVPFLNEGLGNKNDGSRGTNFYGDGGTFGSPSAVTAQALTGATDKMYRTLDTTGAETSNIDGAGRIHVFRPGEAFPRMETKQYSGDGPTAVGGIHFGLGTAATDLSIGRTSAAQPGFTTSAPWVPKLATQTLAANGTVTVNAATGDTHRVTLGANATGMVISNPILSGHRLRIEMIQDATGSRTVVWPVNVLWSGGVAPVMVATANHRTVVDLAYDSAVTKWVEQARMLDVG